MLKIECDNGKTMVSAKVSHGIGQICAELTCGIKGLVKSMDDPTDRRMLEIYVSKLLPKLVFADSMGDVLDEVIDNLFGGQKDETERKQD